MNQRSAVAVESEQPFSTAALVLTKTTQLKTEQSLTRCSQLRLVAFLRFESLLTPNAWFFYLCCMEKRVFFSVGEPSGDQHAARLIEKISHLDPSIRTQGFGGPEMRRAGCDLQLDLTQHAVVGLIEVLPKIREFFRFADQAEAVFANGQIDAVVLVDFPGFNWHIAKRAKRYGIPVHYYCPPQLWAWAPWRIKKMRRSVDHVWSVLPFEHEYFQSRGVPSTLVGHPFFDAVAETELDQDLMRDLGQQIDQGTRIVAVLPGSRGNEVRGNFPIMLQAIRSLHQRHPDVRFVVAACRDEHESWCREQLTLDDNSLPIDFLVGKTSEVIEAAQCAMMVSGSVSLELMARRTPAAVIYRVGRFLHAVGRRLVQVDSLTLPNLIAGRKIFPEFVSVGPTEPAVEFLEASVDAMLSDSFYFHSLLRDLDKMRASSAAPGASSRVAGEICQLLGSTVADSGPALSIRRAA